MINASVLIYVNPVYVLGLRCAFDVLSYANNNSLILEFAGGFVVKEDVFAIATMSHFDEKKACHKLWARKMSENPLIDDVENLMVGIKLRFKTKEEVVGEICGRAFHYMADYIMVEWNTSRPMPSRKTNALPWVSFRHYESQMKKNDDMGKNETEEKDYWFTLLMVDQSEGDGHDPARPFIHWMVTNIKNLDIHSGDCNVPFIPSGPREGIRHYTFFLYKQSKHITTDMANPSDYADNAACSLQYRCLFNVPRFVSDNGLKLVGVLPFKVQADPVSVAKWLKTGKVPKEDACGLLVSFKHEGRMLGECLPKFDAWKALKMELEECVMEFKKKMIMEKMKNMCPELGSHFSEEKMSWNEQDMGDANKHAMDQWMSEKGEEKMAMDKMKDKKDEKSDKDEEGKDLMKPGDEMMGAHCVQVVIKYITHMKMKMMEDWEKSKDDKDGKDEKDDEMEEPDMKEGGKCLEAAKMFMKEQWEKFEKMKKEMEMKKKYQEEWEKWRQWGKGDDDKDKEKKDVDKKETMKNMWEMWEKGAKGDKEKEDDDKPGDDKADDEEGMMKRMMEMMKKYKEHEKEGDADKERTAEKEEKMKKEHTEFMMHIFKSFLTKKMEQIDHGMDEMMEYFKKKMSEEHNCPLAGGSGDKKHEEEKKATCMMIFKEMMIKKHLMEFLKDKMGMIDDMEDMKKPDMAEGKGEMMKKFTEHVMTSIKDEM